MTLENSTWEWCKKKQVTVLSRKFIFRIVYMTLYNKIIIILITFGFGYSTLRVNNFFFLNWFFFFLRTLFVYDNSGLSIRVIRFVIFKTFVLYCKTNKLRKQELNLKKEINNNHITKY